MPQSPVPGAAQAVLNWQQDGQDARNVLHYVKNAGGAFTTADLQALGASIELTIRTNFGAIQATGVKLEAVEVKSLETSASDPIIVPSTYVAPAGAGRMPGNVTLAMSLRTALGGRSGRGRIYHVGMIAPWVEKDTVIASQVTIMLAKYNTLLDEDTASGVARLAVVSRFSGLVQRATGIATPVVSITTDGILDSQRRRLTGRGN